MNLQFAVCVSCLALSLVRAYSEDSLVVTTSQGRIVGKRLEFSPTDPKLRRSVDAYLGIPYAEAPVGPLRFKPPVAKSWSGEVQATELGNRCPQPIMPLGNNITLTGNLAEDCLSLDVFVPRPVPLQAAVLVYIHGGGYIVGAGSIEGFYGTPTAAVGDVIVVALNYRLGALGFLSTGDDIIAGNMGLLDQKLAMEWVRDNIKAFGGDPERVTIFGESAGAACVGLHMVSPGSGGLFRGAIMESGEATSSWAVVSADKVRKRAFTLGKLLNCDQETSEELLICLQKVEDFNTIIEHQFEKLLQELGEAPMILFPPVVDGNFLPNDPGDLYAEGAINDVVSIIGSNSDEGMVMIKPAYPNNTEEAPFIDSATYDTFTQPWLSTMQSSEPIVADTVKLMYRDASCKDAPGCNYLQSVSQAAGDFMFICPQDASARAVTKAGRRVYRYHMTHVPTSSFLGNKWTGCTHGEDLLFVFGVPLTPSEHRVFTDEEARMSVQIIKYWANLAKTGNPNLSSLDAELTDKEKETEWPVFTLEELAYKDLSLTMLNGRAIKAKECLMWNEILPKIVKLADEAKMCRGSTDSSNQYTQDGDSDGEMYKKESCPGE